MNDKVRREAECYSRQRSIKQWDTEEQPRERLLRLGAEHLSNAELLAILLRTGSAGLNVVDTAKTLLNHFANLHTLARKSWKEMKVVPGIAEVKALTLEAVFELSRRLQQAGPEEKITLRCPEDAAAYFGPLLRDLRHETFLVCSLNAAKVMLGYRSISNGSATSTIVDPAEVMRQAILNDAHSILVIHNHPSGNARPSQSDIKLTRRLAEAGKLLAITLEDHLIIAGYDYLSMRAEALM